MLINVLISSEKTKFIQVFNFDVNKMPFFTVLCSEKTGFYKYLLIRIKTQFYKNEHFIAVSKKILNY